MAQALFAAAFDVRIEDLTVVTLAHELAHAYTHLGRDIDGAAWRDPGFGLSDRDVLEGGATFVALRSRPTVWSLPPSVLAVCLFAGLPL